MEQKSKAIKPLVAAAILIVAAAVLWVAWQKLGSTGGTEEPGLLAGGESGTVQDTEEPGQPVGGESGTVQVVHGDGSTKEATAHTDAENLAQVLTELEELAVTGEEGAFGLYIHSVDGEAASDSDHTYWRISQDGEDLMTGAEGQTVADGDHYELTLTTW